MGGVAGLGDGAEPQWLQWKPESRSVLWFEHRCHWVPAAAPLTSRSGLRSPEGAGQKQQQVEWRNQLVELPGHLDQGPAQKRGGGNLIRHPAGDPSTTRRDDGLKVKVRVAPGMVVAVELHSNSKCWNWNQEATAAVFRSIPGGVS